MVLSDYDHFCGDNLTFSLNLPHERSVSYYKNKMLSGKNIAVKSLLMRRGNEHFLFFINMTLYVWYPMVAIPPQS